MRRDVFIENDSGGFSVRTLADPDERLLLILASPVFRARFGAAWPVDVEADDGEA